MSDSGKKQKSAQLVLRGLQKMKLADKECFFKKNFFKNFCLKYLKNQNNKECIMTRDNK